MKENFYSEKDYFIWLYCVTQANKLNKLIERGFTIKNKDEKCLRFITVSNIDSEPTFGYRLTDRATVTFIENLNKSFTEEKPLIRFYDDSYENIQDEKFIENIVNNLKIYPPENSSTIERFLKNT